MKPNKSIIGSIQTQQISFGENHVLKIFMKFQ